MHAPVRAAPPRLIQRRQVPLLNRHVHRTISTGRACWENDGQCGIDESQ